VTVPAAGAETAVPVLAPTSIPRCWPPAYGWEWSKANPFTTSPTTGQVHAWAADAVMSIPSTAASTILRISISLLSDMKTWTPRIKTPPDVVKSAYRERR